MQSAGEAHQWVVTLRESDLTLGTTGVGTRFRKGGRVDKAPPPGYGTWSGPTVLLMILFIATLEQVPSHDSGYIACTGCRDEGAVVDVKKLAAPHMCCDVYPESIGAALHDPP